MCVEKWNHAVRTGDAYEIEQRIRRGSDSAYRWQLGRALPLKDDEQNIFKWFGTWTDIEDQKRAEQTQRFLAEASTVLASSLNYDLTLSRVAHLAVPWIADWCSVDILEDGRLKRLEVAHSDPRKVELVRQLQERYPPDPEHSGPLARALSTGRSEVVSRIPEGLLLRVARDEGHLEILRGLRLRSYMIVPLIARNRTLGAITFVTSESGREYTQADLSLAEDLARRAAVAVDNSRLYRESQEASRLKDEFLATVSHELRTPLNAILGWARMLRGSKMSEEEAEQATEVIERNARSQAQLIEDLLDVSSIITGKLRLNIRPIDPGEIVGLAIESVRPAAEAKGVLLETMLDPAAGPVSGDPDRLQQVVWNLLSNSIKFTPAGGRVRVRLGRKQSQIEIVVSDTGQGINRDFLPFVFERFRQADSTLTRAFGGLGLGLSIVRHLVEMHGGVVTAESEGEGKGATFAVRLPLLVVRPADSAGAEVARPHSDAVRDDFSFDAPPDLTGVKILVVDDDPDARVLLTALLSQCHAEVSACASASEAFERIEAWAPDILVSDIEMPGEDGYSLIRRIRGMEGGSVRDVPAVALTAHARPEDRLRALSSGYQMHVPKPVEPAELAIVIANLARHRRD
jgi:signal transduction histidine kinase/ActR/RegA family two-component response regulator